jgi:hypothetical protein
VPLEWGKTYYWRVDEVNDAAADSPWKGSVWSFTTANFIVVDDFEGYNDDLDAKTTIFDTWIDGFTTKLSGSTVGNIVAPFAERTIVHSGKQAMPMDYDNTNASSVRPCAVYPVQDWTVNGVNTLVLYFRAIRPTTRACCTWRSRTVPAKARGLEPRYGGARKTD